MTGTKLPTRWLLAVLLVAAAPPSGASEAVGRGVVVEEVSEGSALDLAGLEPGDVLLSWRRPPAPGNPQEASGSFDSIFDWYFVELEQGPRGTVEIAGRRSGQDRSFSLERRTWASHVHPRFRGATLEEYGRCRDVARRGEPAESVRCLAGLEAALRDHGEVSVWLKIQRGIIWASEADWEKAATAFDEALAGAGGAFVQSRCWHRLGLAREALGDLEASGEAYRSALRLRSAYPGEESLAFAEMLNQLGYVAGLRGDLDAAEAHHEGAFDLRSRLAPDSLMVALSLNNLGVAALQRGDLEGAEERLGASLDIRRHLAPDSLELAESLENLGGVAYRRGNQERAFDLQNDALEIRRRREPGSLRLAKNLANVASIAFRQGDLDLAQELLGEALEITEQAAPAGLDAGFILHSLGVVAVRRGDLVGAAELVERSYGIYREVAPGSFGLASVLGSLSAVASRRGLYEEARRYAEESLGIHQQLAPESAAVASDLNQLGYLAWLVGDLEEATGLYVQAHDLMERLGLENTLASHILHNLGTVAHRRGDLALATDYYRRSLEIKEKLAPGSDDVAITLGRLGGLARERRDFRRAAEYLRRAYDVQKEIAPSGLEAAKSLEGLGLVASDEGDYPRAAELHGQALGIKQGLESADLEVAHSLHAMGVAEWRRDQLAEAEGLLLRALELRRRLAPDSLEVADTLGALGGVARSRGEAAKAEDFFTRSLELWRRRAPDHIRVAESLYELARLRAEKEPPELEAAAALFARAMDTVERQLAQLGGSHRARGSFRAAFQDFYSGAVDVQLRLGRHAEAFGSLERSRARSFLEQWTERDTVMDLDIPPSLDRRRRRVGVRLDRALEELAAPPEAEGTGELETIRRRLGRLHGEAEEIEEEIRRTSPHLAALRYPRPLDLEGAREALDAGTLLLAYHVGEASSTVFFTSKHRGLETANLEIGGAELGRRVERLRRLIAEDALVPGPRLRALEKVAQDLYALLLGPAAAAFAESERLLILADGPLHYLPWGALRTGGEEPLFLVEQKPIHLAMSATVFAQQKALRTPEDEAGGTPRLAVFGDPRYPSSPPEDADAAVRDVGERQLFDWSPLPYARKEAESIADAFPPGAVRLYLGDEASETHAKSLGREVDIVHFAAHASLDEVFPQSSFLALSQPEKPGSADDNGLLQVWEIYERLRLDAELVVLSACQTAVGPERRGEGLIGLTRAFQYAGARAVMASLWNVNDRRTAELMSRFYRHLRAGESKDRALRAAQLELLAGPLTVTGPEGERHRLDASAAYYWSAFQLYGDWR